MSVIKFRATVSLAEAAKLIASSPNTRYFLRGEIGIGKSSIMKALALALPDYTMSYIDVGNMDLGDVAMPMVDHDKQVTYYAPNARFGLQHRNADGTPKRVCIMLDEFTKGPAPVQNMLHPLLEKHNPRLGDKQLPEGSIVFLTGNLAGDGVGDTLKAHSRNRIVELHVSKPTADEWLEWAIGANVDPVILAWVKQYPHALASYLDEGQKDNPYNYNPKAVQTAFVSPRSLETASDIVKTRAHHNPSALIAALSGAVGESAARDIEAFITYQDKLPTWETIMKNPTTAAIPDGAGACAIMVFGAVVRVDKTTIETFMKYLMRFELEWQAVFALAISKDSSGRQQVFFSSPSCTDWIKSNNDIL